MRNLGSVDKRGKRESKGTSSKSQDWEKTREDRETTLGTREREGRSDPLSRHDIPNLLLDRRRRDLQTSVPTAATDSEPGSGSSIEERRV